MVFRESVENEIWLNEGICGHLSRNVKLYKSSRIRHYEEYFRFLIAEVDMDFHKAYV